VDTAASAGIAAVIAVPIIVLTGATTAPLIITPVLPITATAGLMGPAASGVRPAGSIPIMGLKCGQHGVSAAIER
jgi:hypothetical protein